MTMKLLALAAGVLMVSASAASAAPGRTTTDLNLRSGPGTSYRVLTTMPEGARVDIRNCTGSWCRVDFDGTRGYAAANLLNGRGNTYAYRSYRSYRSYAPTVVERQPTYAYDVGPGYGYDYGYGGDLGYAYEPGISIGFGFGPGWGWGGGWHGGYHHGWGRRW